MRILLLDSGLAMRGGQWQVLRLAEGLAQAGHLVTFLAAKHSPCFENAQMMGLQAKHLTVAALRRISRQVDLTHAHDAHSHTLAALLSAAPVIVSRRVSTRELWRSPGRLARRLRMRNRSDMAEAS